MKGEILRRIVFWRGDARGVAPSLCHPRRAGRAVCGRRRVLRLGGSSGRAFDSLGSLTASGQQRTRSGPVTKEPSLNATYEAMPDSAREGRREFRATVPVWFHVISDGATGNLRQSIIDAQMKVLNLGVRRFPRRREVGLLVHARRRHAHDNADWYNARAGGNDERDMKKRCTGAASRR